ncbi:hypothetical protein [Actinoplanes solisilvae]|uniref:hypothetical protein n=1 Tax=Actinoplanes solisilvae TaxID=2486853 RepID=UPI000FD8D177|nr:hypothetical protein [Actinoplanes solisilvae]
MTTVLAALDTVVDRFGPAVLTDHLALGAALRGLPDPLPEDQISLLTEAAASGAPGRLRSALEVGTPAPAALNEAVALATGAGGGMPAETGRWAVIQLGCAGGLLPRHMADQEAALPPPGGGVSMGRRSRRHVGPVVGAGAVVAIAAVAVLAGTQLVGAGDTGTGAVPSASAGPSTTLSTLPAADATPSTSATPVAPGTARPGFAADPLEVFQAPELRRLAEIYLKSDGVQCRAAATPLGVQEAVACSFSDREIVGVFYKYLGPEAMTNARDGLIDGKVSAEDGTVRQLTWRFVDKRAGTKVGIPMGTRARAEGLRVRFQSVNTGRPTLYFDQESILCSGTFSALTADRTELRNFWANPER